MRRALRKLGPALGAVPAGFAWMDRADRNGTAGGWGTHGLLRVTRIVGIMRIGMRGEHNHLNQVENQHDDVGEAMG